MNYMHCLSTLDNYLKLVFVVWKCDQLVYALQAMASSSSNHHPQEVHQVEGMGEALVVMEEAAVEVTVSLSQEVMTNQEAIRMAARIEEAAVVVMEEGTAMGTEIKEDMEVAEEGAMVSRYYVGHIPSTCHYMVLRTRLL